MLLANLTVLAQEPNVWMPRFFADGMVLQRDEKIPVWGKGTPGYAVTVTLNEKKAKTTVQKDGTWKVYLPKMTAGGPYELVVTSKKGQDVATKEIRNVLIGDVFLCSGQSNMELPIRRCMDVVKDEVKNYSNPNIRYLKFPHQYNYVRPNDDVRTLARLSSSSTATTRSWRSRSTTRRIGPTASLAWRVGQRWLGNA